MPAGAGTGTSAFRSAASIAVPNTPTFVVPGARSTLGVPYVTPSGVSFTDVLASIPVGYTPAGQPVRQPVPGSRSTLGVPYTYPGPVTPKSAYDYGVQTLPSGGITNVPQFGGSGFQTGFQAGAAAANSPGSPIRSIGGAAPVPAYSVTPISDQTGAGPVTSAAAFLSSPMGLIVALGGIVLLAVMMKKKG